MARDRRSVRPRRPWGLAICCLLGVPLQAGAAAFAPGFLEADPPTGDAGARRDAAVEIEPAPAAGNGIRWAFGPWRRTGNLSLDLRRQRLEDGSRAHSTVLGGELQLASYIWQPWFVQVGVNVGAVQSRSKTSGGDSSGLSSGSSLGLVGGGSISVFPMSRFPFQAQFDVGDSRTNGESLVGDYRTYRLGLSQAYRPEFGNESYTFNFDHSRVGSTTGVSDSLSVFRGAMLRSWTDHTLDVNASYSVNTNDGSDQESRFGTLSLRHGWTPDSPWHADTSASWNRQQQRFSGLGTRTRFGTELRQVTTIANWRPHDGDWLYSADRPATAVALVRLFENVGDFGEQRSTSRGLNLAAGLNKDWSPTVRSAFGLSYSNLSGDFGAAIGQATATGTLSYTPQGLELGDWRYAPSTGASVNLSSTSGSGERTLVGLQGSHTLGRVWRIDPGSSVSLQLAQGVGAATEMPDNRSSHSLAHSFVAGWQSFGGNGSQSFVNLSLSDSRTGGDADGHFQLINLQVSRRTQLTRFRNWAASLTLQRSRSTAEDIEPGTGLLRQQDTGWQRFYSGSISYQDQRFLDVPRLRLTALLAANSQQLERRALGDINAPLEQVSESAEARLEWRIGLLDTRLSARAARLDGKWVSSINARIQRRF